MHTQREGNLLAGHRAATLIPATTTFLAILVGFVFWEITSAFQSQFVLLSGIMAYSVLLSRGLFRTTMVPDLSSRLSRTASSVMLSGLMSLAIVFFFGIAKVSDRTFIATLTMHTVTSIVGLALGLWILRRVWTRGSCRSRVLIVGDSQLSHEIAVEIRLRPTYGVDVVGFLSPFSDSELSVVSPILGSLSDLETAIEKTHSDRLILAPAGPKDAQLVSVARRANAMGIPVFVVPRLYELGIGLDSLSPDRVRGYPLVRMQRSAHPRIARHLKRLFDIVLGVVSVLISLPILAISALGIRLSGPGPVLFSQERVGHRGTFTVYKLRTMRPPKPDAVEWNAVDRITSVGRILRGTGIDELPQLVNILRGDMSFVGPRPERPEFVEQFRQILPDYDDRLRMPAGVTGLSQIVGLRGDTSIAERLKFDNIYIDQWSFSGDIQILLKTAWAIIRSAKYEQMQRQLESAIERPSHPTGLTAEIPWTGT